MLTLIKLLKALNSAQAEYQIALAFAFGVLSGILPFFSLINLFILFIIFTINIPIGLYLIFATFFSLIGSLFDPLIHSFGLGLLQNPSLNDLWTNLYNSPIALWLNFNHTITLGSFVIGILAFIPSFYLSKILISKYRNGFHNLFQNVKFLSFLDPYKNSDEIKNDSFIRWWGSSIFVGLFSALIAFALLILDPLVKFVLESSVSKNDTKLQIKSLDTGIFDTKITLHNVVLTKNNKANKIESIMINFNGDNLLRKKLDIESLILDNIALNMAFQSTNFLQTQAPKTKQSSTKKENISALELPSIDSILEKENLKSINEAQEIKKRFESIKRKWEKISKEKIDINNLAGLKKEYKQDKEILKNDLKKIKNLPKEDYNYLIDKYQLNQSGAMNFIATHIDKDVAKYLDKAILLYKDIKPYLESENDPEIIRKKGQWIKYKENNPYQTFALQKLQANIFDPNIKSFQIKASHIYDTKLAVSIKDMKQKQIFVDDKFTLHNNLIDMTLISEIKEFTKANLQSNIRFTQTDLAYEGQKLISRTLQKIDSFSIDINAKAQIDTKEEMELSISSDLDKKVSKAFKIQIKEYNEKYKKELNKKLQAKVSSKLGSVSANSLDEYEDIFKQKAKKKLQQKLENKLKDKFKSLF